MMASAPMAAFMVHPMIALQTEPVWVEAKMVKPFRNITLHNNLGTKQKRNV